MECDHIYLFFLFSSIHALGELGSPLDGVAAYAMFLGHDLSGTKNPHGPILGTCGELSIRRPFCAPIAAHRHLLCFVLPSDQIRFLCIRQVATPQLVFADPHDGFVAVCEK